ncbi:MAG: dihydrolipoamide acetyltransferase family protein [Bacteroidetes bacterium]|nr:dihydrolipoamide acetyltransferase family protein [Bacteroidota bacterium]
MVQVEILMPKMGESIMEATILGWLKKEGDKVEQDESILEVATDKVDTEIPSTHAGVLKEILAKEGDVVEVGKPIAVLSVDGKIEEDSTEVVMPPIEDDLPAQEVIKEPVFAEETPSLSVQQGNGAAVLERSERGRFYSPLVLNIARSEHIPMQELDGITGTGKEGRVSKKDILGYLKTREMTPATVETDKLKPELESDLTVAPLTVSGEAEIIEMDRMRRMIAERMVESKRISAHVTSFVEADVTNIVAWRNRNKNDFKQKEGDNLTLTPIFIEAVIRAIKDYPMINISVDGNKIFRKKDINIGVAVALPSGNLIVPVIHNADYLNLVGLTKKVNDLARRARENKLVPDELSGGTFTVSNVGQFGNVMGTPIIVQPQVAILALGTVAKKPAVIETPQGDTIGIRHKMFLSHSYDHRVVDGSLGGMFVRRVADYLEKFDSNRII